MEASQVFSSWVYQSIRIYHDLPIIEFEYTVGPIPVRYVHVIYIGENVNVWKLRWAI